MGTIFSILFLITLSTPETVAPAQERVAVMPLTGRNIARQKVAILANVLTNEFATASKYSVIGMEDINAMLGFERLKDAVGCADTTCAAEIGGALGVEYLLTGSVSILGEELLVQLTLMDVKHAKVLERAQSAVPDNENDYRRAMVVAVQRLLNPSARAESLGTQEALPTQDGSKPIPTSKARFSFSSLADNDPFTVQVISSAGIQYHCPAPILRSAPCVLTGLSLGKAQLLVTSGKLHAFSDAFKVQDKNMAYHIELDKQPSPSSIVAWTFGGAGIVAGAALTGVGMGLDKRGLVYGGLPTLVLGIGLSALAFLFEGRVDVNYPGIDAFF